MEEKSDKGWRRNKGRKYWRQDIDITEAAGAAMKIRDKKDSANIDR